MKNALKILCISGACVVACSMPLILSALGLAGLGLGVNIWILLGLIGAGLVIALILPRGSTKNAACSSDGSCGCKEVQH